MNELKNYADKLRRITHQQQLEELFDIIYNARNELLTFNRQQLFKGENSDGTFVNPPYRSPAYADLKLHLNPVGVVDLKLTGAFYNSFYLDIKGFPLTISARDEKTNELVKKYGEEIFGLTKQNLSLFIKYQVLQHYLKYIRSLLSIR